MNPENKQPQIKNTLKKSVNTGLILNNIENNKITENNDENEKEDNNLKNNNLEKENLNVTKEDEKNNYINPLAFSKVDKQKYKSNNPNVINVLMNSCKINKNENNNLSINMSKVNNSNNYNNQSEEDQNYNNKQINSLDNNIQQLKNDLSDNKNDISKTCLRNFGDSSYLNSVLQCIGNIVYLKDFFSKQNNTDYIYNNIQQKSLAFVTQRLFKHIYVKRDKIYSIESFLRVLGSLNKIYDTLKSRNANECLIFILDSLHNELNRTNNNKTENNINKLDRKDVINKGIINFKNTYDSIISDLFNWFDLKEYHCTQCGEITYDLKSYNSLQLDILEFYKNIEKKNVTIYDCLNYEMKKKKHSYCYYCKNKGDIMIISGIYSPPKIFVFLLNNGNFNKELLNVNFILEEEINLNKFIEQKLSPQKYELIGIVVINPKDQKYNSFIKSFENQQWYYFFNESVKQYNIDQIKFDFNNGNLIPTILLYKDFE